MMRIKWMFLILFIFSYAYADDDQTTVGNWAQQALMGTLSVSYQDFPAKLKTIQKNYSPNAWDSIQQFMSNGRANIEEKKLTLHPRPLNTPQIAENNDCGFSPCWQVTQSFDIPELSLTVNCSLRVIPGSFIKDSTTPFLIQSLSMVVHGY